MLTTARNRQRLDIVTLNDAIVWDALFLSLPRPPNLWGTYRNCIYSGHIVLEETLELST